MSTIIRLTDSVLNVQGADAHKFLQGQTTTDFNEVTPQQSRLGAYANLKGRIVFSFRAIEWQAQSLYLVMDEPLVAMAKSTFQKYIVFSKAQLSTPNIAVIGVMGDDAHTLLTQCVGFCPNEVNQTLSNEQFVVVRLHGDNRFMLLVQAEALASIWDTLSQQATVGDVNDWRLAQIQAGESQVVAATTELFQPQELNFLNLHAISYNKGCYTGQEIIARLYFRGKLKQWVHRFKANTSTLPELNSVIYDETGHAQGHVILAAHTASHTVELLAIVRHAQSQTVFWGEAKIALSNLNLPYVVDVKN